MSENSPHPQQERYDNLPRQDDFYTAKVAAQKLGITSKTLKEWEKRGEIPIPRRDHNKHRIYDDYEVELIRQIKGMVIRPIIEIPEPPAES